MIEVDTVMDIGIMVLSGDVLLGLIYLHTYDGIGCDGIRYCYLREGNWYFYKYCAGWFDGVTVSWCCVPVPVWLSLMLVNVCKHGGSE